MKGQNNSRSLPHLSVISASGEEADLSESLLSPLTPQLAPTFRAQNLSPFWLSSAVELPQLPGYTSASQGQAGLYIVFIFPNVGCWGRIRNFRPLNSKSGLNLPKIIKISIFECFKVNFGGTFLLFKEGPF